MEMELFATEYPEGSKQIDNTEITTTILYYSTDELKEFKKGCKDGIKKMFGDRAVNDGNISDFLLTLIKNYNGAGTENNS